MTETIIAEIAERRDYAISKRQERQFSIAGTYYRAAAHGNLLRFRPIHSGPQNPEDSNMKTTEVSTATKSFLGLGPAVIDFLAAGLCFRLAGTPSRARSCCQVGVTVIEELVSHEAETVAGPRVGLYHEMLGDLRLVGELGDYKVSYDNATPYYADADSDLGWSMEDEFDYLMLFLLTLGDSVDYGIDAETRERIYRTSLPERLRYKKDNYEHIIDEVIEQGNWESSSL